MREGPISEQLRRWAAECGGTFILVFVGGLSILSVGAVLPAAGETGPAQVVAIAFGFGLALLAALYAVGEISGGHFNPAVSLAALLDKRIDFTDFVGYWVSQIAGAVAAGFVLAGASSRAAVATTITEPDPGLGSGSALLIETVLTAVFVMVILRVTRSERFGSHALNTIAFTLTGLTLAANPLTGASFNPARTLGTGLVSGELPDLWIYLVGPLAGGVLGWAIISLVRTGKVAVSIEELTD